MKTILFMTLVLIGLAAWAPWLKPEDALAKMKLQFDADYRASHGFYTGPCTLVSLSDPKKVYFGYDADALYECEVSGPGQSVLTYTFYESVMGVPAQ